MRRGLGLLSFLVIVRVPLLWLVSPSPSPYVRRRFVTLKEKSGGDIGGLKGSRAKEIGTVKIVWREAVQIGSE